MAGSSQDENKNTRRKLKAKGKRPVHPEIAAAVSNVGIAPSSLDRGEENSRRNREEAGSKIAGRKRKVQQRVHSEPQQHRRHRREQEQQQRRQQAAQLQQQVEQEQPQPQLQQRQQLSRRSHRLNVWEDIESLIVYDVPPVWTPPERPLTPASPPPGYDSASDDEDHCLPLFRLPDDIYVELKEQQDIIKEQEQMKQHKKQKLNHSVISWASQAPNVSVTSSFSAQSRNPVYHKFGTFIPQESPSSNCQQELLSPLSGNKHKDEQQESGATLERESHLQMNDEQHEHENGEGGKEDKFTLGRRHSLRLSRPMESSRIRQPPAIPPPRRFTPRYQTSSSASRPLINRENKQPPQIPSPSILSYIPPQQRASLPAPLVPLPTSTARTGNVKSLVSRFESHSLGPSYSSVQKPHLDIIPDEDNEDNSKMESSNSDMDYESRKHYNRRNKGKETEKESNIYECQSLSASCSSPIPNYDNNSDTRNRPSLPEPPSSFGSLSNRTRPPGIVDAFSMYKDRPSLFHNHPQKACVQSYSSSFAPLPFSDTTTLSTSENLSQDYQDPDIKRAILESTKDRLESKSNSVNDEAASSSTTSTVNSLAQTLQKRLSVTDLCLQNTPAESLSQTPSRGTNSTESLSAQTATTSTQHHSAQYFSRREREDSLSDSTEPISHHQLTQVATLLSVEQPELNSNPSMESLATVEPTPVPTLPSTPMHTMAGHEEQGQEEFSEFTELDLLAARLEDGHNAQDGSMYNQLNLLAEFLGDARPKPPVTEEEMNASLTIVRVELVRRRVDKNGKVKQKLSCAGVSVNKCPICLFQFKVDQFVTLLVCSHVFHTNCIRSWFQQRNRTCPTCREDPFVNNSS